MPISVPVAYVLMTITVVVFASAFAGIRYMLDRLDVLSFTSLRLTIGMAGMLALGAVARVGLPPRRSLPTLLAAGLCGFALYHGSLNIGAARITAGQAAFLVSTIPLWTAFVAWKLLGERIGARQLAALCVSLAGVAWMSLEPSDIDVPLGSAFVVLSAVFAAFNIVLQKKELDRSSPTAVTVWATVLGSLPLAFVLPFRAPELATIDDTGWGVMLYLGLGPIVLGYWLSTIALRALPAYRMAQMLLLIPPIAALLAWIAIGESPAQRTLVGGAIVLFGVFVGGARKRKRAGPLEDSRRP